MNSYVSTLVFSVALCLLSSAAPAKSPERPYRMGPAESWVSPLPLPADSAAPSSASDSAGTVELLWEQQERVVGPSAQRFMHRAMRILSQGGIRDATDIRISFDPAYQTLTLHGIWRSRDGNREDILRTSDVKVLQQEEDLDSQLYNGDLSVIPLLRDVRVGDTLEYAYTIEGSNPVFEGRFQSAVPLAHYTPVLHWRYVLLWPEPRPLAMRTHGTSETQFTESRANGIRTLVWERQQLAAVVPEDRVPVGIAMYPWLQLSEFASWQEVARWASTLFRVPAKSKALDEEIQRLAREPTEEARFLAALHFVQDEIRYLGIELGPNSHQPHAPDDVLAQRFGDCKDKSLLLVTLLKGLGIEAKAALVHTSLQRYLDDWQASAYAFNHAIVRARLGGRDYWVDPTQSQERWSLASYQPPEFARALIVAPETTGLVEIPQPKVDEPSTFVEENYSATKRYGAAELRITRTLKGPDAVRMRRAMASMTLAELSRTSLNAQAKRHANLRLGSPVVVEDDASRDVYITREHYLIDNFWVDGASHEFAGAIVSSQLWEPTITQRIHPLEISHPVHVHHRIVVEAPHVLAISSEHSAVEGPAFRVDFGVEADGPRLTLDYEYRSLSAVVEPAKLKEHLDAVRSVENQIGYKVSVGEEVYRAPRPGTEPIRFGWQGVLAALVFSGTVWFFINRSPLRLWRDFRSYWRRRAFARKFTASAGENAQAPLRVSGAGQIREYMQTVRCACGKSGAGSSPDLSFEVISLGERSLVLAQWHCAQCKRERRVYFEDTSERAA
ncbi:hypothetical protein DRW03_28420 [Corallococcus sp. H22C18031201]|uniref:DUF3857 domain-containing transglutaminase family protein n=1 Tax=Citreicoccus inhibens TaxID=2849499 RepID=UPI000E7157F0|nr:DUF3857 domain-containing protein [Citreicoccus inhibens]MBU8897874.1 DUF3857 domain-containing protein [Citreicoccus inhibens]RJS16998.1 hypothetical protein DRW03_28420 [Corallococcus sp. H22C18031201]